MTRRAAMLLLANVRLEFGNQKQIDALNHLRDLEKARAADLMCEHGRCRVCRGTGCDRDGLTDPCDRCGASGTESSCHCFDGITIDAIFEHRKNHALER